MSGRGLFGVLRREALTLVSVIGLVILAWAYLAQMAHPGSGSGVADAMMSSMPDMEMAGPAGSGLGRFPLTAAMWVVMMVGMMLPSAVPMILLFAAVQRRHAEHPVLSNAVFGSGYLFVWTGFAIAAAAVQTALASRMLLSPSLAVTLPWLGGALFISAGLYELSPLKDRCLRWCQGPVSFIAAHWRPGYTGSFRMGFRHGVYCLGCCWVLMLLLFVGGVMNLAWVALLAGFVLVQKLVLPGRVLFSRVSAIALSGFGIALLARSI